MNLDIHTAVLTAFLLAILGGLLGLVAGVRSIQAGRRLMYFRKRQEQIARGWRWIFTALGLGFIAFFLNRYAEPTAYLVFPPSPTITLTPTITITPTITLTSTISLTPTITNTPSVTNTPSLPADISKLFTAKVTPNPDSVFSKIRFALKVDKNNQPVDPATEFKNPLVELFGTFSYDKMLPGSQWTALWYRVSDNVLICYETKPWDGSTGGFGYTQCSPSSDEWLPGEYETQIYVGTTWIVSSRFTVIGEPIKPSITPTPTRTATVTGTATSTKTPTPTRTPSPTSGPSLTPTMSPTPTLSRTPIPTSTRRPTLTPRPTDTLWPSLTPLVSPTKID